MMPFQQGQRVTGSYFGRQFSGTVESARPHTMNDSIIVYVMLDAPIEVFNATRTALAMDVTVEGRGVGYPASIEAERAA